MNREKSKMNKALKTCEPNQACRPIGHGSSRRKMRRDYYTSVTPIRLRNWRPHVFLEVAAKLGLRTEDWVIILQCIEILDHYAVHLKLIYCCMPIISQLKKKKKRKTG